jgi:hypothetical protein
MSKGDAPDKKSMAELARIAMPDIKNSRRIAKIATAFGASEKSVYRWLSGDRAPAALEIFLRSGLLNNIEVPEKQNWRHRAGKMKAWPWKDPEPEQILPARMERDGADWKISECLIDTQAGRKNECLAVTKYDTAETDPRPPLPPKAWALFDVTLEDGRPTAAELIEDRMTQRLAVMAVMARDDDGDAK